MKAQQHTMKLYAVTGKPIGHSASPRLFKAAFEAASVHAAYTRLAAETAEDVLRLSREIGISGLNVTSPFKEDIARLVDEKDPVATRLDAVNTITFDGQRSLGFNTDVDGVNHMFDSAGASLNKTVVLGAGGAAKAVALAAKTRQAEVTLINRTAKRGREVAEELGCSFASFAEAKEVIQEASCLVSCLPTNTDLIDSRWLNASQVIIDARYAGSNLKDIAVRGGARFVDGMPWLAGHAGAAHAILTGTAPSQVVSDAIAQAAARPRKAHKRIALAGMMGAGKSKVARQLSSHCGLPVITLDKAIEQRAQMTIPEIFKDQGEEGFRRLETATLAQLPAEDPCILDLGGGALTSQPNRELLKSDTFVVWVWARLGICAARIKGSDRPLLFEDPLLTLERLMAERWESYGASADLIVDTASKGSARAAKLLADELPSLGLGL